MALCVGLAFGCDEADACKTKPDCAHHGKCVVTESGACVARSDQDCAASDECKLHGKCAAKSGACVAASDQACQASNDCRQQGACDAYAETCVNLAQSTHAECAKTCQSEGLCAMKAGQCSALSRRHCAGTSDAKPEPDSPCATSGRCTALLGRCVAASNDDCASSSVCKDDARCVAKDGVCVATLKDCAASKACSLNGKCEEREGKCVALASADCRRSSRCKLDRGARPAWPTSEIAAVAVAIDDAAKSAGSTRYPADHRGVLVAPSSAPV